MVSMLHNGLRIGAIAALLSIAAWIGPGDASGRLIGSNLRNPNNATGLDCNHAWQSGFGFIRTNSSSCTWATVGRINATGTGFTRGAGSGAPSTGRIVAVSVKSRASPAALQVTIVRQISQIAANGAILDTSCCQGERSSRVFQPRPNRISTFRVNLPVESVRDPQRGVAWLDYVAISGLGPGSLPIFSQGAAAHENGLTPRSFQSRALWPRVRRGQNRADGSGQSGFEVLARFDFRPSG